MSVSRAGFLAAAGLLATLASAQAQGPAAVATRVALPSAGAPAPRTCAVNAERARVDAPLARVAQKLAERAPVRIVALGSSSTYGYGASTPAAAYPSRLAHELARSLPDQDITVLNRGVNNDEAGHTLARLDADVIAEAPDLVLWQVGTNALLRKTPLRTETLREGMTRMRRVGADVVLIDPQFAPDVIATADAERMSSLISAAAASERAGMFHRFALMRRWHEVERLPLKTFLSWDRFHMNDWGYDCFARSIGAAIVQAAGGRTAAVSGLPLAGR